MYQALKSNVRDASVRYLEPSGGFLRNRVCSTTLFPFLSTTTTLSGLVLLVLNDRKMQRCENSWNCNKRLPSIVRKDISAAFVQVAGTEFRAFLLVVLLGSRSRLSHILLTQRTDSLVNVWFWNWWKHKHADERNYKRANVHLKQNKEMRNVLLLSSVVGLTIRNIRFLMKNSF